MDILLRVLLNFLNWGEPRFRTKAETIVTAMTTEPMLTLAPDPLPPNVPTRVAVQQDLTAYKGLAQLADGGDRAAIADRNGQRAKLEGDLRAWALYLEFLAKTAQSIAILENSGYDLRQPPQPVPQPLPAPELKVFRSEFSGQIDGQTKPLTGALGYEGQYCLGAATPAANWQTGFFSHGATHLKYEGLTPGQMYSFRLRVLGRDGWSPWSTVVQLMAA